MACSGARPKLTWPGHSSLGRRALRPGAVEEDDPVAAADALPAVLARVDTPLARAGLARAVLALRDAGRIEPKVAALALIELADPGLQRLVSSAVVQAAGVILGEVETPRGLLVAG